jgi:hypothetical protein
LSNVTYSPSHRQAGAPLINIQSTLRTAPDLCKNVSLAVLFGSSGNSYTIFTQLDMCIYTHSSQYRDAGQKRNKNWDSSKCRVPRKSVCVPALPRTLVPYTQLHKADQFLGAFAYFRKATISVVMSVRLSVRMKQLGFHWTDFHGIWYLRIFRNSVEKIQVSLNSDKNVRYFTWRAIYVFISSIYYVCPGPPQNQHHFSHYEPLLSRAQSIFVQPLFEQLRFEQSLFEQSLFKQPLFVHPLFAAPTFCAPTFWAVTFCFQGQ